MTIDPGVIYVGRPMALGLRIKWDVGTNVNVGLIPLIHKGLVDVGPATSALMLVLALPRRQQT